MHYNKLLRILYTPRRVFEELREDQHTGLPVLTIIGIVAVTTLVIAILTTPSYEEVEDYRKQAILLEEEPDREYARERRNELIEEVYGPQDLPMIARIGASLTDVPASVLGCLLMFAFVATSFWIVGRSIKSPILWRQWFGFASWIQLPVIPIVILDVILAASDRNRILFSLNVGGSSVIATTLFIWHAWSFVIAVGGLRSWTTKGWGTCAGLTLFAFLLLVIPVFIFIAIVAAAVNLFQ
ncbi:MAG: hypothetical protein F4X44_11970 [Gammaproteobacteria bacterium]|nr:hypothetical protein [Gammaproteobacteria bacterium]MYD81314.1 hypothetical protein [Gammaproteobacteria bacterium]